MATPEIVLGASLLTIFVQGFSKVGLTLGFWTIVIAHIMFCVSFVVVTVKARLQSLDPRLEEAAMDLYANPTATFLRVTFPLVLPGIVAAALLAFSLSFDDFIITNFVSGDTTTFPKFVYVVLPARDPRPGQRHRLQHVPDRGAAGDPRPGHQLAPQVLTAGAAAPQGCARRAWSTLACRSRRSAVDGSLSSPSWAGPNTLRRMYLTRQPKRYQRLSPSLLRCPVHRALLTVQRPARGALTVGPRLHPTTVSGPRNRTATAPSTTA